MRQPFNLRSTPTLYNRIDFEISCLCSISMIVRNLVVFRLCAFILNGNAESDVSQMCTTLVCNARHAEDTLRTFTTLDHERRGDKSVQSNVPHLQFPNKMATFGIWSPSTKMHRHDQPCTRLCCC